MKDKSQNQKPPIPELTRSGYKAFFENFSEDWVFEEKYPLRDDEFNFADFLVKHYKGVPIFAVRRVEKPKGVKMPDFIIAGEKVEQKRLKSESSIKKYIKHAKEQGAKGIFVEKSPDSLLTDAEFSEIVKFHAQKRGMSGYLIAKKNTAESYPRRDGASDGRTSAFSVIDESVSNLILPQNAKKINKLNKRLLLASSNFAELGIKTVFSDKMKEIAVRSPIGGLRRATSNIYIMAENDEKIKIASNNADELDIKSKENKKNQRHHRTLLNSKSNSGNDTTDFYNSIIPQRAEKIKEIVINKENSPEINVLPKHLRNEFFGAETKSWKFKKETGLTEEELKAIKPILKINNFKQIYAIPEVSYPKNIKTPDVVADSMRIEIKTVSTAKSTDSQLRKAKKQIKHRGVVILDASESEDSDFAIAKYIKENTARREVSGVVVRDSRISFSFINEKDPKGSLRHASKSQTGSKTKTESELSHISIIPKNSEKIKQIFNLKKPILTQNNPEKTNKYWQKRAEARFEASEKLSNTQIRQIHEIYLDASHKTIAEIKKLYATYYKKDKTFDKFALNSIEPQGSVQRFKTRMAELGLNQYLPDNYDFRATRLEMLNHQIWAELKEIGIKQNNIQTKGIINTINNTYNRTIYDTQKKFSNLSTFSKLDSQTVQEILNHKIDGTHFSNRIWKNTDILAEQIQKKVATAVSIGESQEKLIKEIQERFSVGRFYAERLVRTETAFYHNIAQLRAYEEMGATKYQILATLDKRTSKTCQHQDHKIYEIKKAKVGENYPPFHPLCRTTTVAYFGEDSKSETRFARNPETGKGYLEENISYKDWQKKHNIRPATPRRTPKMEPARNIREENSTVRKSGNKPVFKQDHEKIQKFVEDLGRIDSKVAKNIYNLVTGRVNNIEIAQLNKIEISKYSNMLNEKLKSNARVIMKDHDFRHLINSGHITGIKRNGETDKSPLTAKDLSNIKDVFKKPDNVNVSIRNGKKRLKIEKEIDKKHRLILEVEGSGDNLRVVTFFNIS